MDDHILGPLIDRALEEDLPDITSEAIFDPGERATARVIVKEDGVIAGLQSIRLTLERLDPAASVELWARDGDSIVSGSVVATVEGTVRALLGGERTLLNLLQRASGVATLTRRFVDAVAGTGAEIVDTRKTIPGLRRLDKAAVALGGGTNHRLGLHDMFLVKDNHVDRAGGLSLAIEKVRASKVERPLMVEVRTIDELDQALELDPDFILLDNMTPELLAASVRRRDARPGCRVALEASGGITLETVREIALTGVDRISIGALTHSAAALDISMKIDR